MARWTFFLGLLLVAQGLASFLTTKSAMARPVVDERNNIALEYVSAWTQCILTIFAKIGSHAFCSS